jgi:hypothetical protein
LIKTWATGKNYVDHVPTETTPFPLNEEIPPKYPRPKTFKEFVTQCQSTGAYLVYDDDNATAVDPNDNMGFVLAQGDTDVLIIRLSPADFIAQSESVLAADVKAGKSPYPVEPFYRALFQSDVDPGQVDTKAKRADLHANRVGEYTIAMCF